MRDKLKHRNKLIRAQIDELSDEYRKRDVHDPVRRACYDLAQEYFLEASTIRCIYYGTSKYGLN